MNQELKEKYTVDYFIKKFEKIPEWKWAENTFHHEGRSCALGHCGWRRDDTSDIEGKHLVELFDLLKTNAPAINDGNNLNYQQPTPKQRVLAALRDVKLFDTGEIIRIEG